MENPQNMPSEQDMRITNDDSNIGRSADDLDAGAGLPPDERMGGTPMDRTRARPEPLVEDEESDVLIETPIDAAGTDVATGLPLEGDMSFAAGTEGLDTENAYEASEHLGGPSSTPSQTGVVGSDTGSLEESESGLEGTSIGTSEPSSTGVVGAGETAEGEITPTPER